MDNSFQELSRSSLFLNKIEESTLSFCNSHLAARTDKGIHLYEFSKNVSALDKKVYFMETFIRTPTSSPCTKLLKSSSVVSKLRNKDMSEMVLDAALWPHCDSLVEEMSTIISFEWSPRGLLKNNDCILCLVNNIGAVELYTSGRQEWICVLSISKLIQKELSEISESIISFDSLKHAVYKLESCSICWSPVLREGESYLVTGQKSGLLLFWLIKYVEHSITAKCCGKIETDFGEIVKFVWVHKSDKCFILICSNLSGQVSAFEFNIDKDNVCLSKSHAIWEHQDRMIVQHIQCKIIENQLLLIFHKHRHLVMHLVDKNFEMLSQTINNINDYRITCIAQNDNNFWVTTVNFRLYRINYVIEKKSIKVEFNLIMIMLKDIGETSELYNMCFSENNVLCAISSVDRRISHRKQHLKLDITFFQVLPDYTELNILLNNPSKLMTGYWDCIELLRCKIVKTKSLPPVNWNEILLIGKSDLYVLKIYLMILSLYKKLEMSAKIERTSLPNETIEAIRDRIFAEVAKNNISKIHHDHCSKNDLKDLDKQCFFGSKRYLGMYCQKYKLSVNELLDPDLLKLPFSYDYICQSCDEEIVDISCKNGHPNMFCMITFTPIESLDYLSCKSCNSLARIELKPHKPLCLFCDSSLDASHLPV